MFGEFFMIIIWVACVAYVWIDSETRANNRAFWTILAFFLPIIGLILWVVMRQPKGSVTLYSHM